MVNKAKNMWMVYLAIILSIVSSLAYLIGAWFIFAVVIAIIGFFYGFTKIRGEKDLLYGVMVVVFTITGKEISEVFSSLFIIGGFISTLIDSLVVFFVAAFLVISFKYLWLYVKGK